MKGEAFFCSAAVQVLAIAGLGYATTASAQVETTIPGDAGSAELDESSDDAPVQEIIVTGSRLGRSSFNSPTPVNVVDQQRMENLNISNVGDALNQLPSFRPITGPATNSFRSSANIAGRSLDLRGLGQSRTLTLVDGRRHVPSGDDNSFDLNSLPTIMIQRSEVVTGGASAAYGANAVSGVVNLLLDTKFTGVKAELSYGLSDRGDARNVYGALMVGTTFADDRGHFVVGGEFADEGATGDIDSRPWGRRHREIIPNAFFNTNPALSNGLPANFGADNTKQAITDGGVISAVSPLQGLQFDTAGNLVPYQFGELFNRAKPAIQMIGGDGASTLAGARVTPFVVATKHYSIVGNVDYELSDSLTLTIQASYAKVDGGPTGGAARTDQSGAIRIQRDNAFLSAQAKALMDAAGVTSIPLSRQNQELGANNYTSTNKTWDASIALKGGLFADWDWDVFYEHGETKGLQFNTNSRLEQNWKDAVDAVFAPAGVPGIAAGAIICRTTIANPTNGCAPANVLGAGNVSAAAAAWSNSIAYSDREFVQNQVAANFRGTLIEGWAGPIRAAIGGEYRTNASRGDNDPNSKLNLFSQQSWTALPATVQKVVEGYAEVNVPLMRDSKFGKSLEIDGAIRRTRYSLSGSATTWKLGAVYQPNDEYTVRVTRSHDIRAPTPEELNPNRRVLSLQFADPKYNIGYFSLSYIGGNPDLVLEQANTFTAGVVLQPHWLPRFRLSVDYYDIRVSQAIDIISSQLAVNLCRAGNTAVCKVGTDSNGNPDRILELYATYQNVNELHARGFEIVSSYSVDLANLSPSLGMLNFSVNGTYVDTLSTSIPDGSTIEFSNLTGNTGAITNVLGVPRWRADAVVNYEKPTYSVTAHMSYIPEALLNQNWIGPEQAGYSPYLPNSVNDNMVEARFYLDLSARIKLFGEDDRKVELFGGINNVFDQGPPPELRSFGGNPLYFDPVGRRYKIGVRARW